MGKQKSKAKGEKKKGPKGKMARAKTKLDRQWGEQVDEKVTEQSRIRKGRSRLKQQKQSRSSIISPTTIVSARDGRDVPMDEDEDEDEDCNHHFDSSSSCSSSSSSSDDNDDNGRNEGNGAALNQLLRAIQKSKTKTIPTTLALQRRKDPMNQESENGQETNSDNHNDSESSFVSDESGGDDGNDDDDDDDSPMEKDRANNTTNTTTTNNNNNKEDPFTSQFDTPVTASTSTTEQEQHQLVLAAATEPTRKICSTPRYLSSILECHGSGNIPGWTTTTATLEQDGAPPTAFSFCRQGLQQQWNSFNERAIRKNADDRPSKETKHSGGGRAGRASVSFSSLQRALYPCLTSYKDLLLTAETRSNQEAIQNTLVLHVLNHVLTSRSRIQKHNRKLKQQKQQPPSTKLTPTRTGDNNNKDNNKDKEEREWRDQGFTRPTVLIMMPTRGICFSFVQKITKLLGSHGHSMENVNDVEHMDRFHAEYGPPDQDEDELEELEDKNAASRNTKKNAHERRRKTVQQQKGRAWQELFGDETNVDDDFKIGMALIPKGAANNTNKTHTKDTQHDNNNNNNSGGGASVKLYSNLYRSDIIIASPVALKTLMVSNQTETTDNDEDDKQVDTDFLSSIEICLISHCNVLMMQNWDHVNDALLLLNQLPKKNNDTDFSRVRNYLLAGQAAHWRQLILCSPYMDPYLSSTFKTHSKSKNGKFKIRRRVPPQKANLVQVLSKVKQVFQQVSCKSFAHQGNDRLKYFEDVVLPQMIRLKKKHTLIFIPSYFDFVSVRNLLLRKEANFVSVSEYARVSEVTRGRAHFLQGRKPIMLYTGRAHFFSRHFIKGVRHMVFFGIPEHAEFYSGMLNALNTSDNQDNNGSNDNDNSNSNVLLDLESPTSCLSLFTKYDAHAMERIVGSQNCERMLKSEKNTFMFC